MNELKDRIYDILKNVQMSSLATITPDGKPWVRYVMTVASPDMTIRCATFVTARKVSQIKKNAEVHLTCGVTDPRNMGPYLQVQGRATLNTGKDVQHAFWTDMLAGIFSGPDDPNYGVIEIKPYYIEYVSPAAHKPEVWTGDESGDVQ